MAKSSTADVILDTSHEGIELQNAPGIVIGQDQTVKIQNVGTEGESVWTETNGSTRQITNSGTLSIDNVYYKNNVIIDNSSLNGTLVYNLGRITAITHSDISDNTTSSIAGKSIWGGIIFNDKRGRIDLIQNVVVDNNMATAGKESPHGGIIVNSYTKSDVDTVIDVIDNVIFSNNTMTGPTNQKGGAQGGIIDNQYGIINKITNSEFKNNYIYRTGDADLSGNYHASGAAIDNYNKIGEISNTLFEDNHIETSSVSAYGGGGAILNIYAAEEGHALGYIGKLENVTFRHNYIESGGYANGGAIRNDIHYSVTDDGKAYIGSVIGNFYNNFAYSKKSYACGGAVYNNSVIDDMTADLSDYWTAKIQYSGELRKDYQGHTFSLGLRHNF